jgi:hypothetical protein
LCKGRRKKSALALIFAKVLSGRSALAVVGPVEAENLVVGAGDQRGPGLVIRLVVLPDTDPFEPDDRGLVVLRQRHLDAAAFAVDPAAEADLVLRVFGNYMAAGAAGVEIAGPVAVFHAQPERIVLRVVLGVILRGDQELHGRDLLLRMS